MKKMISKALAIVLVIMTMIPVFAFAETGDPIKVYEGSSRWFMRSDVAIESLISSDDTIATAKPDTDPDLIGAFYVDGLKLGKATITVTYVDKTVVTHEVTVIEKKGTISKVDLNITAPEVGKAPALPTTSTTNCFINEEGTFWCEGNDTESIVEKFEAGKKYKLCVSVCTEDGYPYEEEVVVTLNGEEFNDFYLDTDQITFEKTYETKKTSATPSEKTSLDKVQLDNEPKMGDNGIAIAITIVILAGASAIASIFIKRKKTA